MNKAEKEYYKSEEYREEMENMLADKYWFMRTESGNCFPMEFGNGWLAIFDELCRQLMTEVGGDFGWLQLKEKWGRACCYYYGNITPYGEQLIQDFESNVSANTCMFCGDEGEMRSKGYVFCACQDCLEEMDKDYE